ncbi:MAG: hypothetical protein JXR96_05085 [Deltaproteobacteria bacterium]|nr:hypothetical protein [Deltaproteobacteria bacterium]
MSGEPASPWSVRAAWVLVAGCWLYLFTWNVRLNNPNERTRALQARAILENGELRIGERFRDAAGRLRVRDLYGRVHGGIFVNDVALVCRTPGPDCEGDLYPAKAPGTALLGLPVLAAAYLCGAVEPGPAGEMDAVWWLRYGGVALPVFLCLLLLSRLLGACGLAPDERTRVVLACALGTSVFPYAIMFVGHALAGAALLAGTGLLVEARRSRRQALSWSLAAGAVSAYAVLLEYHAVVGLLVIGTWAVVSPARRRLVPGFAAGGMLIGALFCWLHASMFGHPLRTGHFFLVSSHNVISQSTGFLGLSHPHAGALGELVFGTYMGLGPIMPWLLLGFLAGAPVLGRRMGKLPLGAGLTLVAIVVVYVLLVSSMDKWRMMNGWSIGPRYLVPAVLPMAFVAGIGWQWLRRFNAWLGAVLSGLAAASLVILAALTAVFPQPPEWVANPFAELAVPLLTEGYGVRNAGAWLGLGPFGLLPFGLMIASAFGWLCWPPGRARPGRRWALFALSLAVALAWTLALGCFQPSEEQARSSGQAFVRSMSEGQGGGR